MAGMKHIRLRLSARVPGGFKIAPKEGMWHLHKGGKTPCARDSEVWVLYRHHLATGIVFKQHARFLRWKHHPEVDDPLDILAWEQVT